MIKTSKLIQGCMTWGVWGKQFSTLEMARQIEKCLDLGIFTFDHADIYGGYTTEAEFGKAFVETGLDRKSIQLISKCGIQLPDENRGNRVKHYQYDAKYIKSQAEQSISNLKSEYLDVFLLHRPSPLMQFEEIAEAVEELKREEKIKYFGVSNFTLKQIELLSRYVSVDMSQLQCSLTHYEPFMDDTLHHYKENQIITTAWSPLGDVNTFENNQRLQEVLSDLEHKYNCTRSQLAIAFLNRHPAGIVPVAGTTQISRLQQLAGALEIELKLQDWFMLLEASRDQEVA
jgi:predicted oxidoreductase